MKERSNLCAPCYYVARGSFAKVKVPEIRNAMDEHESIDTKLLA